LQKSKFQKTHVVIKEEKNLLVHDDNAFESIKSHSGTRFLSLSSALERIDHMYGPLKEYFNSLGSKCPPSLKHFFENKSGKFWLVFLIKHTSIFNKTVEVMERSTTSSFEALVELQTIRKKMCNRLELKYLPYESEVEKKKLCNSSQFKIDREVEIFYSTIIDYLNIWENSLDFSSQFNWMAMGSFPEWNVVESCFEYVASRFGSTFLNLVDRDLLCDEYGLMKILCLSKIPAWLQNKSLPEGIWMEIFKNFRMQQIKLSNMEKLVELALSMPGTSTEVERIFSIINRI